MKAKINLLMLALLLFAVPAFAQGGGQGASYPNNRVYSIGLNANF